MHLRPCFKNHKIFRFGDYFTKSLILQYTKRIDTRPCSSTRAAAPPFPPRLKKSRVRLLLPNPRQLAELSSLQRMQLCVLLCQHNLFCQDVCRVVHVRSSPLQIRSQLTSQIFCRQVRSHLDNQLRSHLAAISTAGATLGHSHNHLRACSQAATKFTATFTATVTAFCPKQDPSRG